MILIVGITGTRNKINNKQLNEIIDFFRDNYVTELHHGDCVGADVTVAKIATRLNIKTVCHPPIKDELRAHHQSTVILEPLSYFARNRKIVESVELMLVVPMQTEWQSTGGTWYTYDYVIKKEVPVKIIWP